MTVDLYPQCARYNAWMNENIFEAASAIGEDERVHDRGAFFGSIHLTLTHLLVTDRVWLARLRGDASEFRFLDSAGSPIRIESARQDVYPDFEELRTARTHTDARILDFAESLTEKSLLEHVQYRDSAGTACNHPLWWAVSHLFNHQTHHRGQVTTLLSQLDHDPGVTDFLMFLREQQAAL